MSKRDTIQSLDVPSTTVNMVHNMQTGMADAQYVTMLHAMSSERKLNSEKRADMLNGWYPLRCQD